MYNFQNTDSLRTKVDKIVSSHIETRGESWLICLGYMECNDYAQSVTALLSALSGQHVRFESVARYIRTRKNKIKAAKQA